MKFDVNLFKETRKDYENCKKNEKEFEKQGLFDQHVDETDPNSYFPVTEDFPFIKKGFKNFIKKSIYMHYLKKITKDVNTKLINLKVEGKENLKGLKGGAIVTCNHCSKVDSFAIRGAIGLDFNFVALDTNNWKGIIGDFARNVGYIPIPSNMDRKLMRKFEEAIDFYLAKKKRKILIYPEQAMWREEPRPRPLKSGAFHYAVKYNVPVLPLFITFKEKEQMVDEQDRRNFSDYTIHILPAIYPHDELERRERINMMKNQNYQAWCDMYEKVYGKKVTYNIEKKSD